MSIQNGNVSYQLVVLIDIVLLQRIKFAATEQEKPRSYKTHKSTSLLQSSVLKQRRLTCVMQSCIADSLLHTSQQQRDTCLAEDLKLTWGSACINHTVTTEHAETEPSATVYCCGSCKHGKRLRSALARHKYWNEAITAAVSFLSNGLAETKAGISARVTGQESVNDDEKILLRGLGINLANLMQWRVQVLRFL